MEKERKIHLSGCELVSLAGSLAICIAEKLCDEDLRKLRFFFNSISSNLAIIEAEGRRRENKLDNLTK